MMNKMNIIHFNPLIIYELMVIVSPYLMYIYITTIGITIQMKYISIIDDINDIDESLQDDVVEDDFAESKLNILVDCNINIKRCHEYDLIHVWIEYH